MEFENLMKTLEDYSQEFQTLYKEKLRSHDHVATGELINTMRGEVIVGEVLYVFQLELQDYWKYIENDTRPHFPPPSAILKWIESKPIIPREVSGITPTKEQLSYLIGRKIAREGTKGTLDLSETIEQLNERYTKLIEDALEQDILSGLEDIIPIIK